MLRSPNNLQSITGENYYHFSRRSSQNMDRKVNELLNGLSEGGGGLSTIGDKYEFKGESLRVLGKSNSNVKLPLCSGIYYMFD